MLLCLEHLQLEAPMLPPPLLISFWAWGEVKFRSPQVGQTVGEVDSPKQGQYEFST